MSVAYQNNLNYGRFEVRTQTPHLEFCHVKQVHGVKIAKPSELPCEADGLMVLWKDYTHPIAIKTADCLPMVIEGDKGVVCLHAGWRGLAAGILGQAEIETIVPQRVFIGPSIHNCCFEVTSEFKDHFPKSSNFRTEGSLLYFDLQTEARNLLRQKFPNLLVEISPICTSCNKDFHSYRRDKTLTERNWNLYIKG